MEIQKLRRSAMSGANSLVELPEYIISTFIPGAQPLLAQYPRFFRFFGVLVALWYLGPIARLQSFWSRFSSLLIATVTVSSEEDLFGYLSTYLAERKTLRADQTLNAISNPPQENRRHRRDPDYEETNKRTNEDPKIKYEQAQGMEIFVYKKRIFWVTKKYGDGHAYVGNRYKRIETFDVSCLGRSTRPLKDLIEDIYYMNKDKERSLTIIRRPYASGYGSRLTWSRLTSKPRRDLNTVILDGAQKKQVVADVEEYMDEATSTFYGNHGIPYRRGYLFFGPPGVGKTSFALALASKFNLDVYVLTLLDQNLTDSDLIALLNQLPGRSLLLLEDIDTAGLNRKNKAAIIARASRRRKPKGGAEGAVGKKDDEVLEDSDDDGDETKSRVSLSGLLNAIDGVAAPEGHILIMTTNKPHELDDALVRAGRISVRVGFKNASKQQAEEIFLRMYVDLQQTISNLASSNAATATTSSTTTTDSEKSSPSPRPTAEAEALEEKLPELAKQFAALIPDYDFSPADLQDYLLIHKRDPVKAIAELESWMMEIYEERRRRDEEKEAEIELKREKKMAERKRFRDDIKAAVREGDDEDGKKGENAATTDAVDNAAGSKASETQEMAGDSEVKTAVTDAPAVSGAAKVDDEPSAKEDSDKGEVEINMKDTAKDKTTDSSTAVGTKENGEASTDS